MIATVFAFALVGAAAQMVDGTLGMGFGVTSATLLTILGYSAVAASAGTHAAKLGTTLISGISHWRVGNVDTKAFVAIGIPGALAGFVGALALTSMAASAARLWMSAVLFVLGVVIIVRFGFGRAIFPAWRLRARHLWPVGLVGGLIDATGGGGWGPIATPSLLLFTRHEPHRVVGTVNAAEFLVAAAASLGFLLAAGNEGVPWPAVIGLVAGGAVTAPIAARVAHRAPRAMLGVAVGGMVLVSNVAVFAKVSGAPGALAWSFVGAIIVVTAVIAARAHRLEGVADGSAAATGM